MEEINKVPAVKPSLWVKNIPLNNWIFLGLCAGLLLFADLPLVASEPDLMPFFTIMLATMGVFGIFIFLENKVYRDKFQHSKAPIDGALSMFIVLRNIIFVLCVIPFIQIIGMMALIYGGIPILIVYAILISTRNRQTPAVESHP